MTDIKHNFYGSSETIQGQHKVTLSNAGRRSVVSGFGITPILSTNDVLTAHIASDNSGDVTILNANLALFILKEV